MRVYYDRDREYAEGRLHPYGADALGLHAYIDFKACPEKIPSSLEDFLPFSDRPAVQTFYEMLAYINGPDSHLESVDCAFRGPAAHSDSNSTLALVGYGRVFIMYRDLKFNCREECYQWLCGKLMEELGLNDPDFSAGEGVVAFSLNEALHVDISDGVWLPTGEFDAAVDDRGMGCHTMLTFWAYGNSEDEVFSNLNRVFENIVQACRLIDASMKQSLGSAEK